MVRARSIFGTAALVTLLAVSMSGCGGPPEDKILTVWTYFSDDGGRASLADRDAAFEKANPGWKVNQVQVPFDQMDQKLLAAAQTGTGPDVVVNNVVVDFPSLVAAGVLKDITAEWNAYTDKALFPESATWTSGGKVYNVMAYTNLLGLFGNGDILGQYGITTMPTTMDELEADLAKVKAGGKYQGLAEAAAPNVEGAWLFMPWLLSQDVNYCNFPSNADKVVTAFNRIEKWAKKGYIPKSAATWDQATAWQKFMTADFAFGLNGNWNIGSARDNAKFAVWTAQFPTNGGPSVVFPGGEGLGIFAKSTHADMAWNYLKNYWLSADMQMKRFMAGGGLPVRTDVTSDPSIQIKLPLPFLKATANTAAWPKNPKTTEMQIAMGRAVSSVISGQQTGPEAAKSAMEGVASAREAGGGGCE
jgi:multiple sugar transport system substrate-binding protein